MTLGTVTTRGSSITTTTALAAGSGAWDTLVLLRVEKTSSRTRAPDAPSASPGPRHSAHGISFVDRIKPECLLRVYSRYPPQTGRSPTPRRLVTAPPVQLALASATTNAPAQVATGSGSVPTAWHGAGAACQRDWCVTPAYRAGVVACHREGYRAAAYRAGLVACHRGGCSTAAEAVCRRRVTRERPRAGRYRNRDSAASPVARFVAACRYWGCRECRGADGTKTPRGTPPCGQHRAAPSRAECTSRNRRRAGSRPRPSPRPAL